MRFQGYFMERVICIIVHVCSYVWLNLKAGYSQGMCDLLAPLLVVFDDGG